MNQEPSEESPSTTSPEPTTMNESAPATDACLSSTGQQSFSPLACRILFWSAAAVFLVGLVDAVTILSPTGLLFRKGVPTTPANQQPTTALAASLALVEGEVQVKRAGRDNWETASAPLTVRQGDTLQTGSQARAVLEIDDGSAIRLNANSQIKLSHLLADSFQLSQAEGETYHRVAPVSSRQYKVDISGVAITALGTAFNVKKDSQGVRVKVIENKVEVAAKDQVATEVEAGKEMVMVSTAKEAQVKEIDGEDLDNEWFSFNKEGDKKKSAQLGVFADEEPPLLKIDQPTDGYQTTAASILVKGTVDQSAQVKLQQDKQWTTIANQEGRFQATVNLKLGQNDLQLRAYKSSGIKTVKQVTVTRSPPAPTPQPTASPTPTTAPQKRFRITSLTSPGPGQVKVVWEIEGYEEGSGYKLVFSPEKNPEYPGDSGRYVGVGHYQTQFEHANLADGGTFHFRVCRYLDGGCDLYTDDQSVGVDPVNWGKPKITTQLQEQEERQIKLSWQVEWAGEEGSTAKGFKIVWNQDGQPTYPQNQTTSHHLIHRLVNGVINNFQQLVAAKPAFAVTTEEQTKEAAQKTWGYKYLSGPDSRSATIKLGADKYPAGTWYLRVCRYRGGYCDYYSNQLDLEIE